ncbi:MAG: AEC family transporter [Oxalicibacterium faecigallinarum]|uniref:AEC family transporter n=1 Tax=Oxalicibacterium faecigallinarum TaxID=573741 RepID=UPI00280680EA|nr:AEC family transporter [Oxalicibacterium faecigallinarum]MDQ7968607.1 AEC family transporter [Oxalicibacterium faecigallinarum]
MEIFERILGIILPVFAIIALGYGYARLRGETVRSDMTAVNRVSMDVLCPLLVFTALAAKDFDIAHNGMLIMAGALISLGSGLLAWPVARLFGYDIRTFVPPMMYNNCGNMGLPLAVLAFGASGLGSAVALFMACNLIYFSVGIKILESGKRQSERHVSRWKFLANPMMIAMIVGTLFAIVHIPLPTPLFLAMKMLGDACIPLMLFALGVRMMDVRLKSWHIGLVGAIVCPLGGLIIAWLLDHVVSLTAEQRGQMFLFAALPPAVFCFMMAEQYQQEPDKVASIVLLGNLASVVFVPLGLWLGLPK